MPQPLWKPLSSLTAKPFSEAQGRRSLCEMYLVLAAQMMDERARAAQGS